MSNLEKMNSKFFVPLTIEELHEIKGGERTLNVCIAYTGSTETKTYTYDGSASHIPSSSSTSGRGCV